MRDRLKRKIFHWLDWIASDHEIAMIKASSITRAFAVTHETAQAVLDEWKQARAESGEVDAKD